MTIVTPAIRNRPFAHSPMTAGTRMPCVPCRFILNKAMTANAKPRTMITRLAMPTM
jgi:hypothetical protein